MGREDIFLDIKNMESKKIISLFDCKLQKLKEQINKYYGTEHGKVLEKEYRMLLREKKLNNGKN